MSEESPRSSSYFESSVAKTVIEEPIRHRTTVEPIPSRVEGMGSYSYISETNKPVLVSAGERVGRSQCPEICCGGLFRRTCPGTHSREEGKGVRNLSD